VSEPASLIRPAQDEDLAEVSRIALAALGEMMEQAGGSQHYLSEDFLRETSKQSTILVAEVDGRVVGYIQYQAHPPALQLNAAAFRPEFQGIGLGSQLFARAVQAGHEAGCIRVMNGVQPTNPEVHRLYLRMGFREEPSSEDWKVTLSMSMEHALGLLR
jgi:ribosomal protein S18 acetylase RimI-like enzyme